MVHVRLVQQQKLCTQGRSELLLSMHPALTRAGCWAIPGRHQKIPATIFCYSWNTVYKLSSGTLHPDNQWVQNFHLQDFSLPKQGEVPVTYHNAAWVRNAWKLHDKPRSLACTLRDPAGLRGQDLRTSLTPDPREARPPQSGRAGARERHGGCGTALSSRAPANAVTPAAANGLQRPALQPRRRRRSAGEPQRPLAARVRPRAESERLSVEFSERLREPCGAGRLWRRRRGPPAAIAGSPAAGRGARAEETTLLLLGKNRTFANRSPSCPVGFMAIGNVLGCSELGLAVPSVNPPLFSEKSSVIPVQIPAAVVWLALVTAGCWLVIKEPNSEQFAYMQPCFKLVRITSRWCKIDS